jgi:hypothetical protein
MMLLMNSLLPPVAPLDRDFKQLPGPDSRSVAARRVKGNTGATPAFGAVARPKCLFLAPIVAAGVAPVRTHGSIYECANLRGQIGYMEPQGRDREWILSAAEPRIRCSA